MNPAKKLTTTKGGKGVTETVVDLTNQDMVDHTYALKEIGQLKTSNYPSIHESDDKSTDHEDEVIYRNNRTVSYFPHSLMNDKKDNELFSDSENESQCSFFDNTDFDNEE